MSTDSKIVLTALFFLGLLVADFQCGHAYRITEKIAISNFSKLTGVSKDSITIDNATNNSGYWGDPYNVTYQLDVAGQKMSGICTRSSFMSDCACRIDGTP